MTKRLLAVLLAVMLVVCLLPASAFAEGNEADNEDVTYVSTEEDFRTAIEKDEGGTVVLSADITLDSSVTIGGLYADNIPTNVVLDLNGHTLRFEFSGGNKTGITANLSDTKLTIIDSSEEQSGQIVSDKDGDLYLISIENGATVELQSGKIVSEGLASYIIMLGQERDLFGAPSLIINGGSIISSGSGWASASNGGTIYINGGTIKTTSVITPGNENNKIVIGDGLKLSNNNGQYTTVVDESSGVTLNYSVAEAKFATLQDAVDAIGASGTITLLNNAEETTGVTVPAGKKIKLDLNGKTLKMSGMTQVVDTVIDPSHNEFTTNIVNYGDLDISNGTISSDKNFMTNFGKLTVSSDVTINTVGKIVCNVGGEFTTSGNLTMSGPYNAIETYGGTVNVMGGTITATASSNNYDASTIAIFNREYNSNYSNGAVVNIYDGIINSRSYVASVNNLLSRGSTLNVYGGNLTSYRTAIYWPVSTAVNIGAVGTDGPVINSTNGSAVEICSGTINVYSGTLNGGTHLTDAPTDSVPTAEWIVDGYRQNSGTLGAGDAITIITHRTASYSADDVNVNIQGGTFTSTQNYGIRYLDCNTTADDKIEQDVEVNVSDGEFIGKLGAIDAEYVTENDKAIVSGGDFSDSLPIEYLNNLKAELYSVRNPEAPYSYHASVDDAENAAQPGDVVTDLSGITEDAQSATVIIDTGISEKIELPSVTGAVITLPDDLERNGYELSGWRDNSGKFYEPGDKATISGDTTFTAVWSRIPTIPDPHAITVVDPANGSIKTSLSNASKGAVITVTATPDKGYELAYITVDGEKITGNTFRMPDEAVTVSAVFVPTDFPFTDVKPGDWHYDYIVYVYENGLMNGTSATTFEPNANMTRAMVWAILARIDGETITGADWAADARAWAMTNGVSDGTDPNGLVTREQFVTMLWRFAGEPASTYSLAKFTDNGSVSDWAETAMAWAVENGIITGVTYTTIVPAGTATRAQCAAMLVRYCALAEK